MKLSEALKEKIEEKLEKIKFDDPAYHSETYKEGIIYSLDNQVPEIMVNFLFYLQKYHPDCLTDYTEDEDEGEESFLKLFQKFINF